LPPAGAFANHDRDIIQQHARIRYHQSVSENPYFFYGPVEMASRSPSTSLLYIYLP
jgi:hypothetical protein